VGELETAIVIFEYALEDARLRSNSMSDRSPEPA
jgi:hypothetical protein